jgi:hypothetical protein
VLNHHSSHKTIATVIYFYSIVLTILIVLLTQIDSITMEWQLITLVKSFITLTHPSEPHTLGFRDQGIILAGAGATTFSTMTLTIMGLFATLGINDIQH